MGEITPTDRFMARAINTVLIAGLVARNALRRMQHRVERMKDHGRGIPFGGYVAPRGAMKNLEYLKKKGLI